jgi:serine/threonine-protein kinase ATR
LPRLLTLWFEYGSRLANIDNQKLQKAARARSETTPSANPDVLQAINGIMVHLNKRLHAYQFLTALPHLISRICHGNQEVFDALREILVRLLKAYPQQTLWQFMASSASTFGFRKTRTAETLDCVTGQVAVNVCIADIN